MKKFSLVALMLILGHMALFAQPCLPDGITFTTQAEIDSFQTNYPNCTEIEGNLIIEGDDITNLDGLSVLNDVWGFL